jgi:DALR anticodon binding domain
MDSTHSDKAIADIQYPSLVQWLADQLARADLENMAIAQADILPLPLFSQSEHQFGTFASPLPLQWSKRGENSDAQAIGNAIIQALTSQTPNLEFFPKLSMHPNGWLYASFGAEDLAKWLQTLIGATPELRLPAQAEKSSQEIDSKISCEPVLFNLQYSHARCCSLLRLARQEKFLRLDDTGNPYDSLGWQTPTGELLLQTKSEQALLRILMQFPQSLSPQKMIYGCRFSGLPGAQTRLEWSLPQKHLYKQAILWSQLFGDFYGECRLFGDIQQTSPALAHARFALVAIVKKVLAFVLEDMLRTKAPTQL